MTFPRRVNKAFTNPHAFKPSIPSGNSFDQVVAHLRLSPDQYCNSAVLREWVRHNKDEKYVPVEVLKAFGFVVD
ncbi:MAG: hypothetical protein JOZ80_03580 [Acidobacteriaceae bacterium]|nr:hypothetical protein [Acidobacteriaceae bacterium]